MTTRSSNASALALLFIALLSSCQRSIFFPIPEETELILAAIAPSDAQGSLAIYGIERAKIGNGFITDSEDARVTALLYDRTADDLGIHFDESGAVVRAETDPSRS